jgi:hypothetical protein
MMYGESPFERVLSEAGGSLMLAVMSGRISYPKASRFPEGMQRLVESCLNVDAATRPFVDDVIAQLRDLQHDPAVVG